MKNLLFLFIIIQLTALLCLAQNDFASVRADTNACELNSMHLDMLRILNTTPPRARIITKSYAGKGESKITSEKRMNYIQKFLEQNKRFDMSGVEFKNSGKLETNENPKTEFYVVQAGETEGKLLLVIYSQPNKTPCLDCCDDGYSPKYIGSKSKSKIKTTKQRKKRRN